MNRGDATQLGWDAIERLDENDLAQALTHGFVVPVRTQEDLDRERRVSSAVLWSIHSKAWLRALSHHWQAGWRLLLQARPDQVHALDGHNFPWLMGEALRCNNRPALQDLAARGVSMTVRDDRGCHAGHRLMEALRHEVGPLRDPVDIVRTLKWLAGKGVDLTEPCPGAFATNDVTENGHTVWTYAIEQQVWWVVNALMPQRLETLQNMPRYEEALRRWAYRCVHRFGFDLDPMMWFVWGRLAARFPQTWARAMRPWLVESNHGWAWTHVPLAARQAIWNDWAEPDPASGRAPWHQALQAGAQDDFLPTLKAWHQDGVSTVAWAQPDDWGERPLDVWITALMVRATPWSSNDAAWLSDLWQSLPDTARAWVDAAHPVSAETLWQTHVTPTLIANVNSVSTRESEHWVETIGAREEDMLQFEAGHRQEVAGR